MTEILTYKVLLEFVAWIRWFALLLDYSGFVSSGLVNSIFAGGGEVKIVYSPGSIVHFL